MKIILVRHGESEHNAGLTDDSEETILTKKGRKQAESLGKKLKKEKILKIYASKMPRAKETAKIISKIINVPVKEEFEELNEYRSKLLRSKLKMLFHKRLRKLKKFLKEISKDKEKNETIVIVAHGITNRIIMGYLLQLPLKNIVRFIQHNTGLIILYWNETYKNWNLHSINNTSHLAEGLR